MGVEVDFGGTCPTVSEGLTLDTPLDCVFLSLIYVTACVCEGKRGFECVCVRVFVTKWGPFLA